jgi:hypothetical protein
MALMAGGLQVGGTTLSPASVAAIRARNAAAPPPINPQTLRPVTPYASYAMRTAGRGSGVLDPTRTATPPATVQALRQQFAGPGVAGFNFLSALLGKNVAGYVGPQIGATPPLGWRPSLGGAAMDVLSDLPPVREELIPLARAFRYSESELGPWRAYRATHPGAGVLDAVEAGVLGPPSAPWSLGPLRAASEVASRAGLRGYTGTPTLNSPRLAGLTVPGTLNFVKGEGRLIAGLLGVRRGVNVYPGRSRRAAR